MKLNCIAALALSIVALSAPTRAQTTTLFSDDFSAGLAQWTPTGRWHLADDNDACAPNTAPYPSPGFCAAFNDGNFGVCAFQTAAVGRLSLAQAIAIPAGASSARLRFMTYEDTECGGGNCGWDHRFVEVSTDNGTTWAVLATGAAEGLWYERVLSLDAYRGASVRIRFRFDPVDGWGNDYAGWLVDDVRIESDSPFAGYCVGKLSSANCIPTIEATGDVSLSGPDDLVLTARLLLNGVSSKLIWSRAPNTTPFHGGILCVSIPAARTTVRSSNGDAWPAANCTGSYAFAFTHAYLASHGVLAGETLYVQASTRDSGFAPPNNLSLSAGLTFTVLP